MTQAESLILRIFDPLNPRKIVEEREKELHDALFRDPGARVSDWELLAGGYTHAACAVGDGDSDYTRIHRFQDGSVLVWAWEGATCHYDTLDLACTRDPRLCDPEETEGTWESSVDSVQERLVAQWDSDPSLQQAAIEANGPTIAERIVDSMTNELAYVLQDRYGGELLSYEHLDSVGLTGIKVRTCAEFGMVIPLVFPDGSVWVRHTSLANPARHEGYSTLAAAIEQSHLLCSVPRDSADDYDF